MPLIHLTTGVLVMLDILAWFIFHLGISFGVRQISDSFLKESVVGFVLFLLKSKELFGRKNFESKNGKTSCQMVL